MLPGLKVELNAEQIKHECKLQRCNSELEAKAEVVFHFARTYFIEEKYKERYGGFEL